MGSVPDNIIVEILSRLSADEVLKCRRVCKKWQDLTSSREFTEKQVRHARPISFVQYLWPRDHNSELELYFLDEKLKKKKMMSKRLCTKFMSPCLSDHLLLVDSCDGLVLFRSDSTSKIFICNPIMQEVVILKKPYLEGYVFGILFHSLTKEYRLLYTRWISSNHNEFFILTPGSKSWRRLGTTTCGYGALWVSPLIMNKSIYWAIGSNYTPCTNSILVFNIEREEFKTLPHPGGQCFSGQCRGKMIFSTMERYGGALCFDCLDSIKVWVLKDEEKRIWEKIYDVNLWAMKEDLFLSPYSRFRIGNTQNKELMLVCSMSGVLIRHNLEKKTIKKIRAKKYKVRSHWNLCMCNYAKSLVSLKDLYAGCG
ncbi:hypothetical protein DITRI_Ditri05aG0145800 [Diplodiscus trichospermus]